jgi:signal transduction histidine kinase
MTDAVRRTEQQADTSWSRRAVSLRAELLVNLTMLATAAMLLVVVTFVAFGRLLDSTDAALYLTALIIADATVFVLFGSYMIRRLILRPLDAVIEAADAVTGGDLERRAPVGKSPEFARLGVAINWMTERLLEERAHLVRVEKMASVGRLAAGVADQVSAPLAAIGEYTAALRRAPGAPADPVMVQAIERESARIGRVVRSLLAYARPPRATPAPMDLSDAVRGVVELLGEQGALTHVRLAAHLAPDLPALTGSREEMREALVNLLLNAAEATPPGGSVSVVTRRATLADVLTERKQRAGDPTFVVVPRAPNARLLPWLQALGNPPEMLQVVIADSGPGVKEEDRERIFDPFFSTKGAGEGAGLGLAVVARLVDSLGGAIWVRRAREGGAAFVMLFPILPTGVTPGQASFALARAGG